MIHSRSGNRSLHLVRLLERLLAAAIDLLAVVQKIPARRGLALAPGGSDIEGAGQRDRGDDALGAVDRSLCALPASGLVKFRKPRGLDHVDVQVAVVVAQRGALRRKVGDDEVSRARGVGRLPAVGARLYHLALGGLARGDEAALAGADGGRSQRPGNLLELLRGQN